MDPTTLTIGGLAALAAFNGMQWWYARRDLRKCEQLRLEARRDAYDGWGSYDDVIALLSALRRNCFITNERGHRVRYVNASQEARAKAEGGDHA